MPGRSGVGGGEVEVDAAYPRHRRGPDGVECDCQAAESAERSGSASIRAVRMTWSPHWSRSRATPGVVRAATAALGAPHHPSCCYPALSFLSIPVEPDPLVPGMPGSDFTRNRQAKCSSNPDSATLAAAVTRSLPAGAGDRLPVLTVLGEDTSPQKRLHQMQNPFVYDSCPHSSIRAACSISSKHAAILASNIH